MTGDERRTARLLFGAELKAGLLSDGDLDRREIARAVGSLGFRSRPRRVLERLAMKRGRLTYERDCLAPVVAGRRAVLGANADGPPRFLVRVDEFPHVDSLDRPEQYGSDQFRRFHEIMAEHGVPYLIAVTPIVSRAARDPSGTGGRPLSDGEIAEIAGLRRDGVEVAVHGLDHRTRDARPRHRSELCGLSAGELRARMDRASELLAGADIAPRVFVPPYNRFDRAQYDILAERYDVIGGGPESVARLGFSRTPVWHGDAVYLPSYSPLYDRAAVVLPAVERLVTEQPSVWAPIVLHWGWEADAGWHDLEELAVRIAPHTAPWSEFLAAVDFAGAAH